MREVRLPGGVTVFGAGEGGASDDSFDWGVFADPCWHAASGVLLDWPDFGVPTDTGAATQRVLEALARARGGQRVLFGCRGGIGRTGTLLAAAAIACGVPPPNAVEFIRRRYRPDAVETDGQERWLTRQYAAMPDVVAAAIDARNRVVRPWADEIRKNVLAQRAAGDALVLVDAVPGLLTVTQRPLRHNSPFARRGPIPAEAGPLLRTWAEDVRSHAFGTAIVLSTHREVARYQAAAAEWGGLFGLLAAAGLKVVHAPLVDPAYAEPSEVAAFADRVADVVEHLITELEQAPKPWLMFCSSAQDRSPPVAAWLRFSVQECELLG